MTFRKSFGLGVSLLVLSLSSAPAAPRSLQNQIIGQARVGDVAIAFVGASRPDGRGVLQYVTYIAGFDGPLFSSETVQDETTAYFTAEVLFTGPPTIFRRGNALIVQPSTSPFRLYFDPTPNGDFARPETFTDGILIAEYEDRGTQTTTDVRSGYFLVTSFDRTQVFAGNFTHAGSSFTLGQVGDKVRLFALGMPDPDDPMKGSGTTYFIQVDSGS